MSTKAGEIPGTVIFDGEQAMRGALQGRVWTPHRKYHVPISNTAAGRMLLENVG